MVEQISTPAGFDVIGFQDGPAALEAARKISPNLIITDYHLDNMTFSGFCKEVHKMDNLTDTYIIALTGAADKLDDSHLKSLGVKAFLKKPLQSDNLLDLIKDLDKASTTKKGAGTKKRAWPPTSSTTDSDDEVLDEIASDGAEEELNLTIPFPSHSQPQVKIEMPMAHKTPTTATPKPRIAASEDTMNGLFEQLLQSLAEQTERKIAALLPQLVGKDLATQASKTVEEEVDRRLGVVLSQERLTQVIEPLLANALAKALKSELAVLEPIIRHSIFEIADPLIKEKTELMVREQAESVKASLTELVREHLKPVTEQVLEEMKEATTKQTKSFAEDMIRTVAAEQIQQTVEKLVPSIAEDQIKAEIARLTEAA